MRWVALQPTLRRLFGNSFLPYHDYGRGGRGWRDLWQDVLALLLTSDEAVDDLLLSYFAGVRDLLGPILWGNSGRLFHRLFNR